MDLAAALLHYDSHCVRGRPQCPETDSAVAHFTAKVLGFCCFVHFCHPNQPQVFERSCHQGEGLSYFFLWVYCCCC